MKELWVRRVSRERRVFVSHPVRLGRSGVAGSSQRSRVCPFAFAGPLNRPPVSPLTNPSPAGPCRSGSRYFKAVPRAPSRGSSIAESAGALALHLFRRSFAAGRAPLPLSDVFLLGTLSIPAIPPDPFHCCRGVFSLLSFFFPLSRRLLLPLLQPFVPSWTATSVLKLRGVVRPSRSCRSTGTAPTGRRAMHFGRSESALVN